MEIFAFASFAALVVAWVALPVRAPKVNVEAVTEKKAA
jgi:hypothetical protein